MTWQWRQAERYIFKISPSTTHRLTGSLPSTSSRNTGLSYHTKVTINLLGEANMNFTLDLYQQLRKSEDNVFYSPASIMAVLAMLRLGAKGNTAQEIETILQVNEATKKTTEKGPACQDEKSENFHQYFHKIMTQLNKSTDAYDLRVANKMYGAKAFPFLQEFVEDIKKFYLANAESLDFVNAAEESQKKINSWVESQTNGKIKNLFPDGTLSSVTVLVLVNAVYFKGQWNHKFDEEYTVKREFWLNQNTSKSVQMMQQSEDFNFALLEDVQAKILEIPYKGKELSMFVLLPNDIDGLKELEDKLTADKLTEWTSPQNMHMMPVYLSLPRFKVEEKYDLMTLLEHMGMKDAFIPGKADFSGMSESPGLVVSKIFHKSFMEVTEEGTEAAASTGAEASLTSMPITEDFSCDHPFLFFIKQNKTGSILFFGRISSP